MGRFDRLRPQDHKVGQMATPLEAARDNHTDAPPDDTDDTDGPDRPAIERPVQLLLAVGIDGQGRLTSAVEMADAARASSLTTEEAVARVARSTIIRGSAGGFITGLGGSAAMPVALPVNVFEFYVQAARMVSAIAILRGHDVDDSQVRKAVLQTLVRTQTRLGAGQGCIGLARRRADQAVVAPAAVRRPAGGQQGDRLSTAARHG